MITIKVDTRVPVKDLADNILSAEICCLEFEGWSNDGREIPEIPKARKYLSTLFNEYPHSYTHLDESSKRMIKLSWCEAKAINRSYSSLEIDWAIDPKNNKAFDDSVNRL